MAQLDFINSSPIPENSVKDETYYQYKDAFITTCRFYKQAKEDIVAMENKFSGLWDGIIRDFKLNTSEFDLSDIAIRRIDIHSGSRGSNTFGEFELYQMEKSLVLYCEKIISKLDMNYTKDRGAYYYLFEGYKQTDVAKMLHVTHKTFVQYNDEVIRRFLPDDMSVPILPNQDMSSTVHFKAFRTAAHSYHSYLKDLVRDKNNESAMNHIKQFINAVNTIPYPAYRIASWKRFVLHVDIKQISKEVDISYPNSLGYMRRQVNNCKWKVID